MEYWIRVLACSIIPITQLRGLTLCPMRYPLFNSEGGGSKKRIIVIALILIPKDEGGKR
jgi:hypothetical protein